MRNDVPGDTCIKSNVIFCELFSNFFVEILTHMLPHDLREITPYTHFQGVPSTNLRQLSPVPIFIQYFLSLVKLKNVIKI